MVEVAIENTAFSFDQAFTYRNESYPNLVPGMRVAVPFGIGNKLRIGIVFKQTDEKARHSGKLKSVFAVLDKEPVLSPKLIELANWMKQRYFCTLYDAAKAMLPSGLGYKLKAAVAVSERFQLQDESVVQMLTPMQLEICDYLQNCGEPVDEAVIAKKFSLHLKSDLGWNHLLELKLLVPTCIAVSKVSDATTKILAPNMDCKANLSPKQQELYDHLVSAGEISEKFFRYYYEASPAVLRALIQKGAVTVTICETYRRPKVMFGEDKAEEDFSSTAEPNEKMARNIKNRSKLSVDQRAVFDQIEQDYLARQRSCGLLYGITGSGKTAVYMQFVEYVRCEGKGAIVMVPEISLTPQTIRQFVDRFGDEIAVFHSGLSTGERLDEWKRVRLGKAHIVIGTRSAVFAPVQRLGLIVIDEEQEHTYKSEAPPRYDTREVARWRAKQSGAFCLLCSATPSVESYYRAQRGNYRLYRLEHRFGEAKLPHVRLIDMNEQSQESGMISLPLFDALAEHVNAGHQAIILMNRRGYHTYATCKICKEVLSCPHCSISLTYHSANTRLMCHYCGHSEAYPVSCRNCGSTEILYRGYGTQRVEEELAQFMPEIRTLRLDSDTVSTKHSLEKKLNAFAHGKYDLLLGTQMVAKGLDFENVTLVGVLSADQMLFHDDFRSSERTFDLLTQVVGRAGRAKLPGLAVVQTFVPENPVIELASRQDYMGFYEQEIQYRSAMLYPPFVDLFIVVFVGDKEISVMHAANYFSKLISTLAKEKYEKLPMRVLSATPTSIAKINEKYRYKIFIKCRNTVVFREMMNELLSEFASKKEYKSVTAYMDMNPYYI